MKPNSMCVRTVAPSASGDACAADDLGLDRVGADLRRVAVARQQDRVVPLAVCEPHVVVDEQPGEGHRTGEQVVLRGTIG